MGICNQTLERLYSLGYLKKYAIATDQGQFLAPVLEARFSILALVPRSGFGVDLLGEHREGNGTRQADHAMLLKD